MRLAAGLLVALGVMQPAMSLSDIMVKILYPTADAVFYIETRTPADETGWRELERQTQMLSDAAQELVTPRWARGREGWLADGQLLVDASAAAVAAARRRDVKGLADLNDALYTACVQCHQHYRPNYPRSRSAAASSIEGIWNFATLTPLERPAEFGDKAFVTREEADAWVRQALQRNNRDRRDGGPEVDVGRAVNDYWFDRGSGLAAVNGRFRTSLVTDPPDGRLPPLTDAARALAAERTADARAHPADGPENRSLQERCLSFNAGPPLLPGPYNNYLQIFLMPGYAIVFTEMIHDARIVPLDGRPHAPPQVRSRLGDSRGRWDGTTLTIDTTNFVGTMNLRGSDENLHLTERFMRLDAETLLYEFTVDDPTAYIKTWTASLPMTRGDDDRIFEYACHEGNYALVDILKGARFQEKQPR